MLKLRLYPAEQTHRQIRDKEKPETPSIYKTKTKPKIFFENNNISELDHTC